MSDVDSCARRAVLCAVAVLAAGISSAQPSSDSAREAPWKQQRTPWGDPDLQGVWRYEAAIPFERPAAFEGRTTLTDEEFAALEQREEQRAADAGNDGASSTLPTTLRGNEYNAFWQDQGRPRKVYRQTSMIVDPPNGRLPYTAQAREAAARTGARYGVGPYESYLDPDTGERCLTDGITAMMWAGPNGGHNRIVQSPGFVTILHEEYRDRRIIPVDGREHGSVPQWFGNTVGRWDNDTLVVETTNFVDRTNYEWGSLWMRTSDELRLIERFRRVGADEIEYTITVEDPKTFVQPWTALMPISRLPDDTQIYEYACHEGNYAMANLLRGARVEADERQ